MSLVALSAVTLTWNSERHIERMARSLLADAERAGVATELIVVDNGSCDATLDKLGRLQREDHRLKLIALGDNYGTTVSRNAGIRAARGDLVLIIDSDTEVVPGSLGSLVAARDRLPVAPERLGIVAPRLTYPNGDFQESARRFPTLRTKIYRMLDIESSRRRDESIPDVLAGRATPVDYAISAAWLVPREVFARIGLLDERIFYAPEDVEFCARCWRSGYEVWYDPEVTVIHDCQRVTNKRPLSVLGLSHARGLARLWSEYGMWFSRPESPRALAGVGR